MSSVGVTRGLTRRGFLFWVIALLAMPACGSGEPRLPTGEPLEVVRTAPEATIAAAPATISLSEHTGLREEVVDFAPPFGPVEEQALLALDLLRGTTAAKPYGGQGVRGVSTLRYDVTIDVTRAVATTPSGRRQALGALAPTEGQKATFEVDVWIDVEGRVRRVQRAVDPTADPPVTVRGGTAAVITVDIHTFPNEDKRGEEPSR